MRLFKSLLSCDSSLLLILELLVDGAQFFIGRLQFFLQRVPNSSLALCNSSLLDRISSLADRSSSSESLAVRPSGNADVCADSGKLLLGAVRGSRVAAFAAGGSRAGQSLGGRGLAVSNSTTKRRALPVRRSLDGNDFDIQKLQRASWIAGVHAQPLPANRGREIPGWPGQPRRAGPRTTSSLTILRKLRLAGPAAGRRKDSCPRETETISILLVITTRRAVRTWSVRRRRPPFSTSNSTEEGFAHGVERVVLGGGASETEKTGRGAIADRLSGPDSVESLSNTENIGDGTKLSDLPRSR